MLGAIVTTTSLAAGITPAFAQTVAVGNTTTVAPADTVPVVAAKGAVTTTTVAPQRYSDPLADTAGVALGALQTRGAYVVQAVSSQNAAGAVVLASPAQTQVASAPSATIAGSISAASSSSWSSGVIDTDQLQDFLLGTAIVVPSAPATQAVISALPTDNGARYQAALHQVATIVASRIKGATAAELERVWQRTDDRRMTVILTAMAQVGTMYRYTGNQPGGFDCSGLTSYSWSRAGVKIPRTSGDQINAAIPRAQADLLPGDLMYRPGHIGLYLGVSDYMVHSPQTGKPVEVRHAGNVTRFGTPL